MRRLIPALVACMSVTAAGQRQPPPVFRAGTDLVEVDVVAHGADGRFVDDLSIDDFSLTDDGRPQRIEQFYLHTTNSSSVPPGAFTRPGDRARTAAPGRMFIVLFDERHLTTAGFKRTQAAAESLFARHFRTGDLGGVLIGQRMVNDRLTSDREELLRIVRNAHPNLSTTARVFDMRAWPRLNEAEAVRIDVDNDREVLAEAIRRACAEDETQCRFAPEAVRAKAQQVANETRTESGRTIQVLAAALNGLSKFDGRKAILLMSEGFMAEETWPLVREAVGLAARANARIYALDARGLDRSLRSVLDVDPVGADSNVRMLEQLDPGADSINSLAVDSGGFVVRNTNQFDKAVERIAEDSENYYVLAYRPPTPQDGRFHPIRVTVRRRDVTIRARRGYVALERSGAAATTPAAPDDGAAAARPDAGTNETSGVTARPAPASEPDPSAGVAFTATPDGGSRPAGEPAAPSRVRPHATENVRRLAPTSITDRDAADGWDAFQRGDVDTAYARLSVAASRDDAQLWVHYTLGISSYALARYKEASGAWERVRTGAAEFEPVYFDLIDAYLQQREFDRAVRVARAALERWPRDAEIYQALGVVQTVRGSLDDAVKSFESAVALAPSDPNTYFNLGKAMELRYFRTRRYVDQLRRWVSNEKDRAAAIENYQRHVDMHGVYAEAARAGLQRLEWVPTGK